MKSMVETHVLWENYRHDSSKENLFKLVEVYQPFLQAVASSISFNLPNHIDRDDILSEGQLGLISAIERYVDIGYKFETYASLRIRGQILDKLRAMDWTPRSLRTSLREIEDAESALVQSLQRTPTNAEIADYLAINSSELSEIRGRASTSMVGNLDEVVSYEGESIKISDLIPDTQLLYDAEDYEQLKQRLSDAVGLLDSTQSSLFVLYYLYNFSFREIGEMLGVTESRVCQLHIKSLSMIRKSCLAI